MATRSKNKNPFIATSLLSLIAYEKRTKKAGEAILAYKMKQKEYVDYVKTHSAVGDTPEQGSSED